MFIEIFIVILFGVLAGTFTGLVPGVHVNLVAVLLLVYSTNLLGIIGLESLMAFIIAMSITHSFVSTIPSIFLGAPEPSSALSVLPGHRMLIEGKGLEAVKLTIIGSLFGLIISFIFYLVFEQIIKIIYPIASRYIAELLFIAGIFIISKANNKFKAILIYVLSGVLGVLVLDARMENALFPLLSGLFGVSTLLFSLKEKNSVPKQEITQITDFEMKKGIKSSVFGTLSGFITAILPGLGSSTAVGVAAAFTKDDDTKNFLIMIGSISTVNFFMSIAALNIIEKARNGAIITIKELWLEPNIAFLIFVAMVSGGISVFVAKYCAERFLELVVKINYSLIVRSVILFIVFMTVVLSGFQGFYVLFVATIIGLYANIAGIPRNTMMACIMVPVMIYFI